MMCRIAFIGTILVVFLSSCQQELTQNATTTSIPTGMLTPYHTRTPKPIIPTDTIKITIPSTPAPTPTPFLHTITDKDTMLGIAYQYGITLEELQAANPGVDPHYLSVGKQLIIPLNGEIPETVATPTPAPVKLLQADCFRTGDGGVWCILPVQNILESDVENLSAWIGLYTSNGKNVGNQVAFAPLNLLRAGETMPLMTYFSPPIPEQFQVRAELLSSLIVSEDDTRYINLPIQINDVEFSSDKKQAEVRGELILSGDRPTPSQVWLLGVAYDSTGNIIGARKLESEGEMQFEITIYSLAGMIDHIEVLAEIRP